MRTAKKTVPTLDLFRLAAVLLVVMNHTSPLADVSAMADFWLTRVLARVAVPFFLMTTGYFLSRNHWAGVGRQLKKLCLLYGVCILLYLPVNLYAGSFTGPADVLRKLLVDGTFYHLWYFPATILGIVIARWLSRLGLRVALPVAALLYLIGLGGDSYYGLVSQIPLLRTLYDGIFTLCGYTRNGLFFAPLFLLLGAAGRRWNQKLSLAGFFLSLAAMSAEGLWLHRMDVQRHDSMYLALPLCIVCLFSLLLGGNKGESRKVREFSTAMYVLHPLCIVLVRGAAKLLGLGEMLIENSVLHFIVVLALSALLSAPCLLRLQKKPSPTARAWREVDLAALGHNAQVLRNTLAPGTELMAVVKAEAYGHGGAVTARTLQRAGVRAFAVACLAEGIALRKAGIRGTILILGYTSPEEAPLLTRWHLTQTVADIDHGRALAARGRRVHVHLAKADADLIDGVDAVHDGGAGAQCDQRIHVRRALPQRLEADDIVLAVDIDDGQQQQKLRECERHRIFHAEEARGQRPAHHVAHREIEQRDGEDEREGETLFHVAVRLLCGAGAAGLGSLRGGGAAGLCMQRRTVARLFDRGDDLRGRELGFVVFDDHAVFQQVDRDLLRAGLLGDGLFHAAGAGGAAHAGHVIGFLFQFDSSFGANTIPVWGIFNLPTV